MQTNTKKPDASIIVIENWISPLSALTPSLIVHNLELQGIQLPQSLTIEIDRGHYDCTDTNYAVITVRTDGAILFMNFSVQPQSFYCSFFSQKAVQGMDPSLLQQHWLGNCYLHVGGVNAPMCSFRHESGYAKTWKKMAPHPSVKAYHLREPPPPPCPLDQCDGDDAMSIDPIAEPMCPSPSPRRQNNHESKPKSKDNIRIIQLQKKNLLLRTELDMVKSEFRDLKAEVVAMKEALGTVRDDQVGLAQRHKEQEAATRRANQCMQDWTNKQIVERVWILETQQAQLLVKHKEAQCKSKHKKTKKEIKRLSERLDKLENINNNDDCTRNRDQYSFCNKCDDGCITNPFDFREIYEHYDQPDDYCCNQYICDQYHHDAMHATNDTTNDTTSDDSCPSLELIANYYADEPNPNPNPIPNSSDPVPTSKPKEEESDFDDDDFFEIQVEVIQEDDPK